MRYSVMEVKPLADDFLVTIMDWSTSQILTVSYAECLMLNKEEYHGLTKYVTDYLNSKNLHTGK